MTTATLDKLYLELSLISKAKTKRESELEQIIYKLVSDIGLMSSCDEKTREHRIKSLLDFASSKGFEELPF